MNANLSALREKQLEKEEEERILEENWSKVHESLKRVRNLQDEIDGEPLSPFVLAFASLLTPDLTALNMQTKIECWTTTFTKP